MIIMITTVSVISELPTSEQTAGNMRKSASSLYCGRQYEYGGNGNSGRIAES